jgi:hypothetical protein
MPQWIIEHLISINDRLPPSFWTVVISITVLGLILKFFDILKSIPKEIFYLFILGMLIYFVYVVNYYNSVTIFTKNENLDKALNDYQIFLETERNGHNVIYSKDSTWKIITGLVREDNEKRKAVFDIGILTKDYYWEKGSTKVTYAKMGLQESKDETLIDLLEASDFKHRLSDSKGIICIGNSSYEGNEKIVSVDKYGARKTTILSEEARANERAEKLSTEINKQLQKNTPMFTINIGRCKVENKANSNLQRSIVILFLKKFDQDVNLNRAVFNAVVGLDAMPFRVIDYSLGTGDTLNIKKTYN